uniref:Uncharacterized protein n=1 Tax=Caenorhabditis japonica TaxID=281687 RepID=A0A8R1IQC6_CAEJA
MYFRLETRLKINNIWAALKMDGRTDGQMANETRKSEGGGGDKQIDKQFVHSSPRKTIHSGDDSIQISSIFMRTKQQQRDKKWD